MGYPRGVACGGGGVHTSPFQSRCVQRGSILRVCRTSCLYTSFDEAEDRYPKPPQRQPTTRGNCYAEDSQHLEAAIVNEEIMPRGFARGARAMREYGRKEFRDAFFRLAKTFRSYAIGKRARRLCQSGGFVALPVFTPASEKQTSFAFLSAYS